MYLTNILTCEILQACVTGQHPAAHSKTTQKIYWGRGSNSRPLACEASVIATRPTQLCCYSRDVQHLVTSVSVMSVYSGTHRDPQQPTNSIRMTGHTKLCIRLLMAHCLAFCWRCQDGHSARQTSWARTRPAAAGADLHLPLSHLLQYVLSTWQYRHLSKRGHTVRAIGQEALGLQGTAEAATPQTQQAALPTVVVVGW